MDLQSLVDKSQGRNIWTVGNDFMYDFFSQNLGHTDPSTIVAKVWILGRTYSASIERHRNKGIGKDVNFYEEIVPSIFQTLNENHRFDKRVRELVSLAEEEVSESVDDTLSLHYDLQSVIESYTKDKKTSFCSKYLHFHCPNCYFIYDSITRSNIGKLSKGIGLKRMKRNLHAGDLNYAFFYQKCQYLKTSIEGRVGSLLSLREFDNLLMNYHRW